MPKVKKKHRVVKPQGFKVSKDIIIGFAIGAIVIFVICLMVIPGGQTSL